MNIALGILGVALLATLCDFTWYTLHIPHNIATGVGYGALLLTAVGAVLGRDAGRLIKGMPIGTIAGAGGALTYYLLVALVDRRTYGTAIPASWIALWLIVATLDGRWLRAPDTRSWREVAIRGVAAAILSGGAFLAVMNVLWGRPPETGKNYAIQLLAWIVAWAPGLLALTWKSPRRPTAV